MPSTGAVRNVASHAVPGTIGQLMRVQAKTVSPELPPPSPYVDDTIAVGVELEYEGARRAAQRILDPAVSSGYWSVVSDASLRNNGEEFILREGLEGRKLAFAIREFFELTRGTGLQETGRTSCHIHLDMRDAQIELLRASVLVYQAVEKMFWSMVHRQRQWTGYCIPLKEAQGQLVSLLFNDSVVRNPAIARHIAESVTRYSGLNVAAISRHGTIEFRHFNNPRDEAQMNEWINVCMSVRLAGADLVRRTESTGVLAAVNASTTVVIDAVLANTILREACERAAVTSDDMQLEVDHLLAVTESLNPTTGVNTANVLDSSARFNQHFDPSEASENAAEFGHATGIGVQSSGLRLTTNARIALARTFRDYLEPTGALGTRSLAQLCEILSVNAYENGWPKQRRTVFREVMRVKILSQMGSEPAVLEAIEAICLEVLPRWEFVYDVQYPQYAPVEMIPVAAPTYEQVVPSGPEDPDEDYGEGAAEYDQEVTEELMRNELLQQRPRSNHIEPMVSIPLASPPSPPTVTEASTLAPWYVHNSTTVAAAAVDPMTSAMQRNAQTIRFWQAVQENNEAPRGDGTTAPNNNDGEITGVQW